MFEDYKGMYEPRYWIRRIRILVIKLNDISREKIDLNSTLNSCYQNQNDEYLINLYERLSNLYKKKVYNLID